jgi:hypothetical protein
MEQAIRQLCSAANSVFVSSGIRFREYELNGQAVAQAYLPSKVTGGRAVLVTARVAMPSDVIGGKVGRKIKKVAKKIAKSKLLKSVASVVATVATGGAAAGPIALAASAAKVAGKLKAMAKKAKTPRQKALVKVIAKSATRNIQRARTNAPPVAQGYPTASAAALPDARLPGGTGYGDTDPEEVSEEMDPDQGAPAGEVEADQDVEITPDDDTSEEDEPE